MSLVSLPEFAARHGISLRRAEQLAHENRLPAHKVGRIWLVDSARASHVLRKRRPLSQRSADALARALEGKPPSDLDPQERARLRSRVGALREDDASALLRDWMRSRQIEVRDLAVNSRDLPRLLEDNRIVRGGVSDARAGLSAAAEAELYVSADDFPSVERDWLLVPSDRPNVRVHIVDQRPDSPLPLAWLLADLADWGGPRERARIRELIAP